MLFFNLVNSVDATKLVDKQAHDFDTIEGH